MKVQKNNQYYTGGLAELVSSPTLLTYSFFAHWFTGKHSIGKAMDLLGLPYEPIEKSIVELYDGDLVVNLATEEQILYAKTVFSYKKQTQIHDIPILSVNPKKMLVPQYVMKTSAIAYKQGQWLAHPATVIEFLKQSLARIPTQNTDDTLGNIDELLQENVWPAIIATGTVSEFFSQVLAKEYKNRPVVQQYVSRKVSERDWFFRSIADMQLVKNKTVPFSEYVSQYGLRSDKDYELTSPRWYEIPESIKKRIAQAPSIAEDERGTDIAEKIKRSPLVVAVIESQILRSEAKKKALIHIDHLRKVVLKKAKTFRVQSATLTRDVLFGNAPKAVASLALENKPLHHVTAKRNGVGIRVSIGKATGTALHITDAAATIPPNSIGIFPNASPEFAMQYPKCQGMIFLKGGQTSHGAIVAREFGIPAIISHDAAGVKNGAIVTISGDKGEWELK